MRQFVSELYDYEFNGEAKIDESEDEEEMLTMVIDEDQDSLKKKLKKNWKLFLNHLFHMKLVTRRK